LFAWYKHYNANYFSDKPDVNNVFHGSLTLRTKAYSLAEVCTLVSMSAFWFGLKNIRFLRDISYMVIIIRV